MTTIHGTAALATAINSGAIVATAIDIRTQSTTPPTSTPEPAVSNVIGGGRNSGFGVIDDAQRFRGPTDQHTLLQVRLPNTVSIGPNLQTQIASGGGVYVGRLLEASVGANAAAALIASGYFAAGLHAEGPANVAANPHLPS